ncbi:hypothetical protein PHMEG_00037337 [Phytophthora megakarya]|uniref:Uncharacterized protein n=1 Tax=Phytophthora megakarya TaxID=4795 RepID=A0A225UK47_9STRA|nr:hypothetical protein PHMEG_00037337 [Phytophthora megakarya]
MVTTLELLHAERQTQDVEEAQPPFRSLDEVRSFITGTQPAPIVNISLEMCRLHLEEHNDKWRLELYESLDVSCRGKYAFGLTLWKSRNASLNKFEYQQGFCYRFDKVHSVKALYGNLVGSIQIRQHLRANPLVIFEASDDLNPGTGPIGQLL